jgi:hypothetical protein
MMICSAPIIRSVEERDFSSIRDEKSWSYELGLMRYICMYVHMYLERKMFEV